MGVLLEQQLDKISKIIDVVDAFFNEMNNGKNIYCAKKLTELTCSINKHTSNKTLSNIITTSLHCYMDVTLLKTFRFIY